jgi:hypothetical protein
VSDAVDGLEVADPFDLPEWLGTEEVTWYADAAEHGGHLVRGRLTSGEEELPCDLLAVDEAYPVPVVGDDLRRQAHQAWRNGEVLLLTRGSRAVLASPGASFHAEQVLEALGRLARAVGASPDHYLAALRVGVVHRQV